MALDFFAGCVGGAAGLICGHPLDTVKVRLQTQSPDNIKYRGTFHALSTIVKQESVPGLFKGIVSPLYGVAAINALVFGVYGTLRPFIAGPPGNDALWAHFLAGAASGSVQSVISSPMELVKIRMQMNESGTGNSSWKVLKEIFRKEGGLRRGVYKGWATTLCREIPGFGSYFATYELLTTKTGREIGTFEMLMAGGMSGVVSWVVTYPTDVVKTRLQMDTDGKYKGMGDCIKKVYQTEGLGAFTRGLTPAVLRAFPTNAATFTVVTWIMRLGEANQGNDLQSGGSEYLEEWDMSRGFSGQKIYQSFQFQMPQPQFLTVDCFLKTSVSALDSRQRVQLITGFDGDNQSSMQNGMDYRHNSDAGACQLIPLDDSQECNLSQAENSDKTNSMSLSLGPENSQETGSETEVAEPEADESNDELNYNVETTLLNLRLRPTAVCKICKRTDQCVC